MRPLFLLFLIILPSILAQQKNPSVGLQVYYECLCPDSVDFIVDQLYPAYQKLGQYLDIKYIPFGFASVSFMWISLGKICSRGKKSNPIFPQWKKLPVVLTSNIYQKRSIVSVRLKGFVRKRSIKSVWSKVFNWKHSIESIWLKAFVRKRSIKSVQSKVFDQKRSIKSVWV